jgi:hypothetical protein
VIKEDIIAALSYFHQQHDQHFHHLNKAHMVLLPKKVDAQQLNDFRPRSLTHSIAKLFSKILATCLSLVLNDLISRSQSSFIKRRSIQDNFLYTQNLVRDLQRRKQPDLFLKLDIAKAFDSVRWDFLLEVLEQFGFPPKCASLGFSSGIILGYVRETRCLLCYSSSLWSLCNACLTL